MRTSNSLCASALSLLLFSQQCFSKPVAEASAPVEQRSELWGNTEFVKRSSTIAPKVFIISMVREDYLGAHIVPTLTIW
jgi:hypothetical protein